MKDSSNQILMNSSNTILRFYNTAQLLCIYFWKLEQIVELDIPPLDLDASNKQNRKYN